VAIGQGLVSATPLQDADRIGERERLRRHMRGVLAEAVPGDVVRPQAVRRQHSARRDADRHDRRLLDLRQPEVIFGAVENDLAQRAAPGAPAGGVDRPRGRVRIEGRIGFVEDRACLEVGVGERLAHADLLRSLSGKEKCNHECDTAAPAISCSTR